MFLDACGAIGLYAKAQKTYFSMGDSIYRKCDFEPREGYFNHATHKTIRARPEMKGDIAVYRVTSTQVWESDFGNEYLDGGDFNTDSDEEYYEKNAQEMKVWRHQHNSQAWLVAEFVACLEFETEFPNIDWAPF